MGGQFFKKKIVEICEEGELDIEFSQEREQVTDGRVEMEITFVSHNFEFPT